MNDFRIPVCIGKNTRQYCHEVNKAIKRECIFQTCLCCFHTGIECRCRYDTGCVFNKKNKRRYISNAE